MGSSNTKLQALHNAVLEDDAEKVRTILSENGLDPNARGEGELTALHIAVSCGSLKSVQVLLGSGRVDLSTQTANRETPLILAAAKGHEDVAIHLLESHTDNVLHPTAEDRKGLQALHYASMQGLERLVPALLQRRADSEVRGGRLKMTPLMLAAQNGQEAIVRTLLEAGSKVNAVDAVQMTALHHACMADAEECVRLLVQVPDISVDAKDISGCTPLLYCVNNRNKALEKVLVSHGASLTAALDAGFSELCYHTLQEEK